jgi:hypothetical protein
MLTEAEKTLDLVHSVLSASLAECVITSTALAPALLTPTSVPIGYEASTQTIKFKVTPANIG